MYYRPADELFFREINFTEKIYGAKQQHFHIYIIMKGRAYYSYLQIL